MKYLFKTLLLLVVILFSLKAAIHIIDRGHKINYSIGNFNISETFTVDKKHNYYFKITSEHFNINFQINKNYNKKDKIITKIKYYNDDEYKCILPIFKNNDILTDIMCVKDNTITYYHDLNNSNIDKFAKSLKNEGYNKKLYIDKTTSQKLSNQQTVYEKNLINNHYIALENYKGITLINNTVKNIKLFKNDIYKKTISIFTDKYYIVADYDQQYTFKKFYVVNLINGSIKEIRSYNEISFDSIIQGAVKDEIYLFDKDAEVQYKISLKYESIEKIENNIIKYYNGKWSTMTLNEALNDKKFNNYYSKPIDGYIRIDKVGKKNGYYYLYKKDNDKYLVYRADLANKKLKTYLFTTTDLDSIIYSNNYIYFKDGTKINYYYDYGVRKIIENSELEFNNDISFGVYTK